MSSRYLRGKTWWYQTYIDGRIYRESLRTRSSAVAKERQAQKDIELKTGEIKPKDIPALSVLDTYIAQTKFRRKDYVNKDILSRVSRFLDGIMYLKDITRDKMEQHISARLSEGRSKWDANNTINYTKTFLNWCVLNGYINNNPLSNIKTYKTEKSFYKYLNKDEQRNLLSESKAEKIYPAIVAALNTGMRKMEIKNLPSENVNIDDGYILVQNTKGKKDRKIPLSNAFKSFLRGVQPSNGKFFDTTNDRRIMRRLSQKIGIKRLGWHHFRHTFGTELALSGADALTIKNLMGHSSIKMSEKYLHGCPAREAQAVEKLCLICA